MRYILGCALAGLLVAPLAGADEAFRKLWAEIEAKQESIYSFTAEVTEVVNLLHEGGNGVQETDKGTIAYLKKDRKVYYRQETRTTGAYLAEGEKQKVDDRYVVVSDGEFLYREDDLGDGTRSVSKSKADPDVLPIEFLARDSDFDEELVQVKPDETVEGRAAYVLETEGGAGDDGSGRTRILIDKERGYIIRLEIVHEAGKKVMSKTHSKAKVNGEVPMETFRYTPPEGVAVIDQTKDE